MRIVVALSLVWLVAGCGLFKDMGDTKDEVRGSNDRLDRILALLSRAGEAAHRQTLLLSMEQLLKPENTAVLSPPTRMMPFAETFAREASSDELVRSVCVLYEDALHQPADHKSTAQVSIVAMSALAGLTPEPKARVLLGEQIPDGRFEETAYAYAVARFAFIRDLLFKPLLTGRHLNRGILDESLNQFQAMKALAQSPYVSRFELDIPELEIEESVKMESLKALGQRARSKFARVQEIAENPELVKRLAGFDL
jgi:hypothetical protein